jgi:hypothetical protein
MAEGSDTSVAWENPLMPNVRLRQIYLAMMQSRTVARALPSRQRSTIGLEASLVSSAIDLIPGDLVSDVLGGAVIDFLRGMPQSRKGKKRALAADCGAAGRLPGKPGSAERVWTAVGAAAALQSLSTATQTGVVVLYLLPGELPSALLKKVLLFAHGSKLPLLCVVLPDIGSKTGTGSSRKTGQARDLARQCGVPAIPADADDAVAIYRVSQESIGHARSGGGPALIECVPYALPAGQARRGPATDGIGGLEQYMLPRKVVSRGWIDRETKAFARRLAQDKGASK